MEIQKLKKRFSLVAAGFGISALSVLLLPFTQDKEQELTTAGYAMGILFWAGMIAGIIGYIILRKQVRQMPDQEQHKNRHVIRNYIFSNRLAAIADSVMIVSFIATIYYAVRVTANQTIALVFMFLMVAGVYAHFLLNGRIFRCLYQNQLKEERE